MGCKKFTGNCLECPFPSCIEDRQEPSEVVRNYHREYSREWMRQKRKQRLMEEYPFLNWG